MFPDARAANDLGNAIPGAETPERADRTVGVPLATTRSHRAPENRGRSKWMLCIPAPTTVVGSTASRRPAVRTLGISFLYHGVRKCATVSYDLTYASIFTNSTGVQPVRHYLLSVFFVSTFSFAAVPVSFVKGTPANAADVNRNFNALDSAIQKNADQIEDIKRKSDSDSNYFGAIIASLPTNEALKTIRDTIRKNYLDHDAKISALQSKPVDLADPGLAAVLSKKISRDSAIAIDRNGNANLIGDGPKFTIQGTAGASVDGPFPGLEISGFSPSISIHGTSPKILMKNQTYGHTLGVSPSGISFVQGSQSYAIIVNSSSFAVARDNGYGTSQGIFVLDGNNASFSNDLTVHGVINGTVIARGITASNVADYVFDSSYTLLPLSEVEKYVKENRHLPDIPSAESIAQSGMNLTEMNLALLKKVEELTLHAITQSKKLEEQNARIQSIETKCTTFP